MRFVVSLVVGLVFALAAPAGAHAPGLSTLLVEIDGASTRAQLSVEGADAERAAISPAELRQGLTLDFDGARAGAAAVDAAPAAEQYVVRWRYAGAPRDALDLAAPILGRMAPGHRLFVRVERDGVVEAERFLDAGSPALRHELATGPRPAVAGFARLGVEHILLGFDHLAFLLALLLTCRRAGGVVRLVTAFSLGHSASLVAAAFGWVPAPSGVVEPAIAASIVYVAMASLLRRDAGHQHVVLVFALGLIHGLGFAGAVAELGLGPGGEALTLRLLLFNLGVEAGQLACAAALWPVLQGLRRWPRFQELAVPALFAAMAGVASAWFVERLGGLS